MLRVTYSNGFIILKLLDTQCKKGRRKRIGTLKKYASPVHLHKAKWRIETKFRDIDGLIPQIDFFENIFKE